MSPEQARGAEVDKRSDIWAFGCCLFEMLTGRRTFVGDTPTDTIAKIIEVEPDWRRLDNHVPARVRDLLARCLTKDPRNRLHDIADARIEIERALAEPACVPAPRAPTGACRLWPPRWRPGRLAWRFGRSHARRRSTGVGDPIRDSVAHERNARDDLGHAGYQLQRHRGVGRRSLRMARRSHT